MINSEFEQQKIAYNNYVKCFIPELLWTNTIYKDLYSNLTDSLALTKVSLGDYFFEQYVNDIDKNLNRIENEVNIYTQNNNYDKIQKEHLFYHKLFLENRINELKEEYSSKKTSPKENKKINSNEHKVFDFNLMSENAKVYIKNETDEKDIKWHWIEEPFFTFSDFEKDIEERYNSRLKFVLKENLSIERVTQFIKDTFQEIEKLKISEPIRDYFKLCFAEKNTNWFSNETLEEFERYFKEYSNYKFYEFKKEFLNNKLNEIQNPKSETKTLVLSNTSTVEKNIIVIKEKHGNIFSNNGFVLFEYILTEHIKSKGTKGRYEDLSYHYRRLFNDKFIHQKPESFRLWFINKYQEEFSKIKTTNQTKNPQREKNYSNALDWFKSQNQ